MKRLFFFRKPLFLIFVFSKRDSFHTHMKSSQSNVYEPEPATAFFRSRTTAKEPEPTSTMHIPAGIFPAECQRFPQATCSVHFGTGHRTRADSSNPKRQPPHTIRPGSNATTIPNRNKNDKTMKKTLLFLSLAFLICGKASAQKDDAPYTAFSFGLFPPLCTNGTQAPNTRTAHLSTC